MSERKALLRYWIRGDLPRGESPSSPDCGEEADERGCDSGPGCDVVAEVVVALAQVLDEGMTMQAVQSRLKPRIGRNGTFRRP